MSVKLANSLGPCLSDGLHSNEIKKKIKRSFFKEDVAVKSYKCDFIGNGLTTSAKLYISNRAFYVVHRPKRKKLTTMPFTEINDIKVRSDDQGVDVFLANENVYAFTRFQRPESAVAFLLNFWNMIRKEKLVSKHGQFILRSDQSSSNGTNQQNNSVNPITPESIHKFPTTISLNSSASISESDSADSRRRDLNSTSCEQLLLSSMTETKSGADKGHKRSERSVDSFRFDSKQALNRPTAKYSDKWQSGEESNLLTNESAVDNQSHNPADPNNPSSVQAEKKNATLSHSASTPNTRQPNGLSLSGCTLKQRNNHQCLSETSSWSLWPLSYLPYPFSPPHRFTMIIAYAILGFLLFSTMHLYHRLAVFDLQGSPFIRSSNLNMPSNTVRSTLQTLEIQLTELVELTGQLAQSLMQMTGEVREMRVDSDVSSVIPATTITDPLSTKHTDSGPPV